MRLFKIFALTGRQPGWQHPVKQLAGVRGFSGRQMEACAIALTIFIILFLLTAAALALIIVYKFKGKGYAKINSVINPLVE